MLTTPSILLSDDRLDFLSKVVDRMNFLENFEYWCRVIADNGGCREIYRNDNGKPVLYLRRYYIYRSSTREAMIHQFFLGDKGPLHDHPAESWGQILKTGYNERLCTHIGDDGKTWGEYEIPRKPGDWSHRPASYPAHDDYNSFHKVKLFKPEDGGNVFTFFVMEKRNTNSWGFRDNDGRFVPFDQMNKQEKVDSVQSSPDQYGYGWFPTRVEKP